MFCMQNAMIYVKREIFLAHYSRCVRALWMLSLWHGSGRGGGVQYCGGWRVSFELMNQ